MKLVTAISAIALVLAPAAGLAQAPANGQGDTKDQPGLVEKAIGAITGRSPGPKDADAKSGDRDSAASAGDTNYPDFAKVKKTNK